MYFLSEIKQIWAEWKMIPPLSFSFPGEVWKGALLAIHAAVLCLTTINTPEKPRPNYSFSLTESP